MLQKVSCKFCLGLALVLLVSSCYRYDPIEAKERLIEQRKNNPQVNPEPTPEPEPNPEPKPQPEKPDTPDPEKPNNTGGEEFVMEHYDFNAWEKLASYSFYLPSRKVEGSQKLFWSSASNLAFQKFGDKNYTYPVTKLAQGYKGSGALIVSRSGMGSLIAGALYSGHIVPSDLTLIKRNPPRFGQDCNLEPVKIKFFYQYKAGQTRWIYGGLKGKDLGAVRAYLYEVTDDKSYYLDNDTHKIENNKRIILKAEKIISDQSTWKETEISFKVINQERYDNLDLSQKKYRLTIIMTSSAQGAQGIGAYDSSLKIDEMTVYYKK